MAGRQPKRSSLSLGVAAAFLGLGAGLFQVIILRELLVLAGGNELSLGLAMACWLFWTALGSLSLCRAAPRIPVPQVSLALLLTGLGGAVSFGLARLIPKLMGLKLGIVCDLGQGLAYGLAVLAPVGLAAGAGFPLILAGVGPDLGDKSRILSWLYGLEAVGAGAAGALFALILVHWLNPAAMVLSVCAALGLAAAWASRGLFRLWAAAWVILFVLGLFWSGPLEQALRALQWQGRNLLAVAESPYAQLAASQAPGQINFFASGLWLFSYPDRATFERSALLPLLANPQAKSALFLGGGASPVADLAARRGGLSEVTAVELDPWLGEFVAKLLPLKDRPLCLKIRYGDGRLFLRQISRGYDLIVMNLPPPVTMQLNRFYSAEGFSDLAKALNPGGTAVISLPGMEYTVGRLQAWQLNSILAAARPAFRQILMMSGPELKLFLCPRAATLPPDAGSWQKRLAARAWTGVAAVREDTLALELNPFRLAFLRASLEKAGPQAPNRDFKPRALLFDSQLWGARLGGRTHLAALLAGLRPSHVLCPLLALAFLFFLCHVQGYTGPALAGTLLPTGIFTTGLTDMALSVLLLMAFQVLFGSVYVGLALIMAGFMAGLAAAALVVSPFLARIGRPLRGLMLLSGLLALACLLSWGLINWLHTLKAGPGWSGVLLGLAALDGGLTGAYFGLAGRAGLKPAVYDSEQKPLLVPVGGRLYGLDLAGGILGALLPVVLLPTIGLKGTLGALALINLIALAGFGGRSLRRLKG